MNRTRLGLTLLAVTSTAAAFVPGLTQSPLWTVFALVYFSVAPGHALVSALFPASVPSLPPTPAVPRSETDSLGRWIALSVGVSVVLAPLVGLALVTTPVGLRTGYVVLVLNGLVVLFTFVAAIRTPSGAGSSLTDSDRARPSASLVALARGGFSGPRLDVALNVVLVLCLVLFVGSFAYAATEPTSEPGHTQFFLPGGSDAGGSSEEARYPSEVAYDEPNTVSVAVTNREGRRMNYSVVVELQRTVASNGSADVVSSTELERDRLTVEPDETVTRDLELVLGETGEDLRLAFLLYRGEVPPSPDAEGAYRQVHLWVNSTG
ncbi:MAG: DUF1616 domain-containing protein [Haloarculaceae archaeon]